MSDDADVERIAAILKDAAWSPGAHLDYKHMARAALASLSPASEPPTRAPGDEGERFAKAAMEWCRLHSMCERMTAGSPRYEEVSLSRTLARGRMMELYAHLASRGGDASRGGGGGGG